MVSHQLFLPCQQDSRMELHKRSMQAPRPSTEPFLQRWPWSLCHYLIFIQGIHLHGFYSKYECNGQMVAMDQPVKNVRFALMGNFCLWKAFSRPVIPTVQYIIRSDIFSFEFGVCALNKLNYMVNSPCHLLHCWLFLLLFARVVTTNQDC